MSHRAEFSFAQLQAMLAAQSAGTQLNYAGGLRGVEGLEGGARHGQLYNELDQISRSVPMAMGPSAAPAVDHILRIVEQADHNTLLRSNNEAYAAILDSHKGTKEELATLKRAFDVMVRTQAQAQATQGDSISGTDAFQAAPSAFAPMPFPATPAPLQVGLRLPTPLPKRMAHRKEDLPNIKYWTRKDYEKIKNKASSRVIRPTTTISDSSLPFMEHEDGSPLSDEEAARMRATARGVFSHLLMEKSAPEKWGQVSVVSQDFFFNVIAERFPFASMCEDLWKIQLLATICYPSWYRINKDKFELPRRDLTDSQRRELWVDQHLEHSRQVKEEMIDQFDRLAKRARTPEEPADRPKSKVSKKSRLSSASQSTSSSSRSSSSTSSVSTVVDSRPSTPIHDMRPPITVRPPTPMASPSLQSMARHPTPSSSSSSQSQTPKSPAPAVGLDQNTQAFGPLSTPGSIPGVEDWAYDSSGLDKTSTQETALDRLSILDSTPFFGPSDDKQLTFSDAPSTLDTIPLEHDHSFSSEDSQATSQASQEVQDMSCDGDLDNESRQFTPTSPPADIPDHRQASGQDSNSPSVPRAVITHGQAAEDRDILADTTSNPNEDAATPALGRIRPTPQNPHPYGGSNGHTNFEEIFDLSARRTPPGVRNPLASLVQSRIPSSNVNPETLESTYTGTSEGSGKENEGIKPKGRGRPPNGKVVDPDQLIRGTVSSCTPRNLFALEYRNKNNKYPTERIWQDLDKTEVQRFEGMSREKKAARAKAKADGSK